MAIRSIYQPKPLVEDERMRIIGDEHKHLAVTRVDRNEVIEVFDGRGTVWTTTVDSVGVGETILRVVESRKIKRDPVGLILALALIRPSAFEFALEKVVEIGVSRIVPFAADRSNAPPLNRPERMQRIVIEAAKQSKQYNLPVVEQPTDFEQVISMPAASKIVFAERDAGPLEAALNGSPVLCLVGPEGGWTNRELSAAGENGFHLVSLGAAILKSETAAIVGTSLIRYELGR
jgi:16S rRNA (uracil1498-N3)-methyltransferase